MALLVVSSRIVLFVEEGADRHVLLDDHYKADAAKLQAMPMQRTVQKTVLYGSIIDLAKIQFSNY